MPKKLMKGEHVVLWRGAPSVELELTTFPLRSGCSFQLNRERSREGGIATTVSESNQIWSRRHLTTVGHPPARRRPQTVNRGAIGLFDVIVNTARGRHFSHSNLCVTPVLYPLTYSGEMDGADRQPGEVYAFPSFSS